MFKRFDEYDEKRLRLIVFAIGIIYTVLTVSYLVEYLKGNRSLDYVLLYCAILWIPYISALVIYRITNIIRPPMWVLLCGYVSFYIFTLWTTVTDYSWIYLFPLMCIVPMMYSELFAVLVCFLAFFAVNVVETVKNWSVYNTELGIVKLEQRYACILLCCVFLYCCVYLFRKMSDMVKLVYRENNIDSLTGLRNEDYAEQVLKYRIVRSHGAVYSMLYLNVDNFRYFNEVFGHSCGDDVLRLVTDALKSSFSSIASQCEIVRLSGDVFFVLVMNRSSSEVRSFAEVAKRMCNRRFIHRGGEERYIGVSCVLTDTTFCVCDYAALLGHCMDLMDQVRAEGQNQLLVESV